MIPEPQNPHLNKDGGSASGEKKSQMLNIKGLRNLYMVLLLLSQVIC
jgi:hypothetical protein